VFNIAVKTYAKCELSVVIKWYSSLKTSFTLKVTDHCNRLPRETVESPSLEIFHTHLNKVLRSLLWATLLRQGGWTG